MSEKTEIASNDAANFADNEHILLALCLEQARSRLLDLLLENRKVAGLIAGQLLSDLRKGIDCSEIIVVKNSESYKTLLQRFLAAFPKQTHSIDSPLLVGPLRGYVGEHQVVQKNTIVQVNSVSLSGSGLLTDEMLQLMVGLHFLPVFLIEVASMIMGSKDISIHLDDSYKCKLAQCRNDLKTLRQQMIANNTGLVAFVAHRYKAATLGFEDLMQEGLVGLIKAVDRFDPERGICFSTYAIYWIRQAISRLIVKQDKTVPLPVALAEKSSAVFEAMRHCYLQHERWPSLTELKAACDLSEQEIKTISSYYQATHTLDASCDDGDDSMDVMATMQQHQFSLPLDELIESDLALYVDKAVASLPEKQAAILAMRFGLKNHTEMTLQAVADHLHVTRERVRQIQNEALNKLKQQFGFDLMLFLEPKDS